MPDRSLPEEIVDEILIRLPSKDVGRCRVVSPSWRDATYAPQFMLEHHRRQPSLPIIGGLFHPMGRSVVGAGACSQQLWPFLRGLKSLYASCDGFLIVSHRSGLYICNPVIRKHALLPLPLSGRGFTNKVIGFYRHHPTGEYRVLWVSNSYSQNSSKYSLHNLTLGSDESRHITVTMPAVSSPSIEHKLLLKLFLFSYDQPAVHHLGSLHWCPAGANDITGGGGEIILFDTELESFRWMRSPTHMCSNSKLFNLKGALAFWGSSTPAFADIKVWVMQDYEAEIWSFKYQIDVSMVEASRQLYVTSLEKAKSKTKNTPIDSTVEFFSDMALLNERELLISFNNKHVLRCDIDGKFLGIVKSGKRQYCLSLNQHRFQESIVPIPYYEMQEEDEGSPFSTGDV